MKKQRIFPLACAAAGMFILILDGKTAISGAREGIDLCIRTLVPSLFPFFVLSALITGTLVGQPVRIMRPLGRLCGIPEGAESLMAAGFLGGYPVGAQNVGQAYRNGQISKSDAQRILALCNNAGPAFLFGIVGPLFSSQAAAWALWGIHILSALPAGMVAARKCHYSASVQAKTITLTAALERSVKVMAIVCGWVVLFRIVLNFLESWIFWLLPVPVQVLLTGMLELSNGCVQLGSVENEGLRFVIAGVLLAFGGICVTMQTASAASGLSMRYYLPGKLLQCCFSFLLCIMAQVFFPVGQRWLCPTPLLALITVATALWALLMKRNKKTSSNPALSGV